MKMLEFAAHFSKPPSRPHILHKIDKKFIETILQIHTEICVKNTIHITKQYYVSPSSKNGQNG